MSPASHMVGRLRELYGIVLGRMRSLNERPSYSPLGGQRTAPHYMVEQLEQRLLLSTAPAVLSINRETPAVAATEATSVTYAVAFSAPVTGVTSADFQLALTGATTASSTVVVSPSSGYNSVYNVTVNNIAGNGTLGLNLVDNGSILDQAGNHLANSSGTFQAQQTFATGSYPVSVAVADVNGDGKSDLVVANVGSNTVSVMLGNGDGTFQAQKTFAVGSNPDSVTVADVNGDGQPDLVVANSGSNTVSVLLGNGDGTFQGQKTFAVGSTPKAVTVADINGDGKPDLIVACNSYVISVLLGNGDGTFQAQKATFVGGNPCSVAVADVNGDGKPDVVFANATSTLGVLLGNGDGTFQVRKTFATGSDSVSVAVADVNKDGKPDLFVANWQDNTLGVLMGNGDGTFQPQQTFAAGSEPSSVAVADVNGDGNLDLVVANESSNALSVLLGNGDGTFQAQQTFAAGAEPVSVAVGDMNGDGNPDLVVANESSNTVRVLLGNCDFTGQIYTIEQPSQLAFAQQPTSSLTGAAIDPATGIQVAVENVLGDTVTDNISDVTLTLNSGTFASGGNTVTVAAVNGIATFNNLIINAIGNYTLTASDGSLTQATSQSFTIFGQAAQLTFTQQPTSATAGIVITPAVAVTVQDQFGNTVTTDSSTVTLMLNDGTFASGGNTVTTTAANGIATFNNLIVNTPGNYTLTASDGILTNPTSQNFSIFGAAKLGFAQQPSNGKAGVSLSPAVNVAVQDQFGNTVPTDNSTVTLTLSSGTFASGSNIITVAAVNGEANFSALVISAAGTYTLTASDGSLTGATSSSFTVAPYCTIVSINRESPASTVVEAGSVTYTVTFGTPVTGVTPDDFQLAFTGGTTASSTVAVSPGSGYNSVYNVTVNNIAGNGTLGLNLVDNGSIHDPAGNRLANANGTFQPQQTFATGSNPTSFAVADVNGDGKPDVVVCNQYSNNVSVLLGNGDGTFQAQQTSAAGLEPQSVAVADVNGDGKLDLVVANWASKDVSVLLGNGDGTFQSQQTFAPGVSPNSIAVADLNGDGKPDLVVANENYNGTISVLLGNGDGTFQAQQTFNVGSDPTTVVVVDVNGDGKPDLAVANWGSWTVSVLLGNGDGTFQPQTTFAVGPNTTCVAAADLNGDGKEDLVTSNGSGGDVSVLLGNGNGTFQTQKTFAADSQLSWPFSVAISDVNGDGKPDLVVANWYSDDVSVLSGNGDGTFLIQNTFAVCSTPYSVAVADINGDGAGDVIVTNFNSNSLSVLLNNHIITGQLYAIDQPNQLAFTQPPNGATAGKAINPGTGIQVAVEDSGGATVGIDSSLVTLTLNGGTFADGGTTETATAAGGIATFSNLVINAAGSYSLTASDGVLTGTTSSSFTIYPLGDVIHAGFINSTNGAADIDAVYAHFGDTTGRYDVNGDGVVNQSDVDYLVRTILHTNYGDANLDGKTDFLDFQILLDHWQVTGVGWAEGDFNGDTKVDFLDFQTLLDYWNPGGWSSATALVPEPATPVLSGAGGTATAAQPLPAVTNQTTAVSMPASAVPAVSGLLSSGSSLIQSGATLAPARSDIISPAIQVADLLVTAATPTATVYAPTVKPTVISRRPNLTDGSWTSDNDKVDLLTQLIKPVVA